MNVGARSILLSFLLLGCSFHRSRADEWWAWTSVEYWRNDRARASIFAGNRLDTRDGAYVQILSPRFRYAALPWLDLGLGQSVLSIENVRSGERHWQWRPELEVNPRLSLGRNLDLELRNRMEWRWNEHEAFTTHRSRHRLQATWKLPQPLGPITRVFINNEVLTDLHRGQRTENRAVPAGLTLRVAPDVDLDLFYMVLSSRAQPAWHHETVIGSFLRIRL